MKLFTKIRTRSRYKISDRATSVSDPLAKLGPLPGSTTHVTYSIKKKYLSFLKKANLEF